MLLTVATAPAPARIEPMGSAGADRVVSVAGVPVVTVGRADAEDNATTRDALAGQWAVALDQALVRAHETRRSAWGRLTSDVRASVQASFSRLGETAIRVVPRMLAALLVVLLFWLLAAAIRAALRLVFHRFTTDLTIQSLVKQTTYYTIWVLGLIVAVSALGFQPQTVVTGLGLTGLALGFALKDIISNFVSGLLILALRPFDLGDQIVVGPTEGSVEHIRLRATDIRTYDGRLVLVPNAELFTSRVTNNTESPVRRATVELYIGYDSDLPAALEVIRVATQASEGVLAEPAAVVRVGVLGQSDILVESRFWTDSRRSDFTATQAQVRASIVQALCNAGIGLPDPDIRALVPRDATKWRAALGAPEHQSLVDTPVAAPSDDAPLVRRRDRNSDTGASGSKPA